ncbi:MAG: DUF1971 domain-containing protein [Ilumatobacteraceae bacterium]
MTIQLPPGLEHTRTTDLLDQDNHPGGLLRAHRVADGVWARLVVRSGRLVFVFEDAPDERIVVAGGESVVIPPARLHHVKFDGEVTFQIEFHRAPTTEQGPAAGDESGGLVP